MQHVTMTQDAYLRRLERLVARLTVENEALAAEVERLRAERPASASSEVTQNDAPTAMPTTVG